MIHKNLLDVMNQFGSHKIDLNLRVFLIYMGKYMSEDLNNPNKPQCRQNFPYSPYSFFSLFTTH